MLYLKRFSSFVLMLLGVMLPSKAQEFSTFFSDSTLRIDYTFSGDIERSQISLNALHRTPGWYGRKHNLDSLALLGNGRITMRDSLTQKVIYRYSFSSLYQEWLTTPEAHRVSKSFENVFLLPYPKQTAEVTIEIDDIQRRPLTKQRFTLNPKDILIQDRASEPKTPHEYLHRGKYHKEAIDIVILAEGYRANEMQAFVDTARRVTRELLAYEPFKSYKEHINIIAVKTVSADSGVSLPREKSWKRTAFSSHFDTFYSDRYLTTSRVKTIHEALVNIPYEHIIILANTPTYGGGGIYNSYTISSIHPKHYLPVVVHEFGHSFGGLADEYYYDKDVMTDSYGLDVEPWEQNITSLKDFWGKKWSSLIRKGTPIPTPKAEEAKYGVGVYEGAAYTAKGLYKAREDCRMRTNTYPTFCPACHKALDELIRYHLPPLRKGKP